MGRTWNSPDVHLAISRHPHWRAMNIAFIALSLHLIIHTYMLVILKSCVQIYNPDLFFEIQCFHLFLDTCSPLLCTCNLLHRLLWRYYGDHSVLCMVASTQYSIIAVWNIDNRICTTFIHYYQITWTFHKHVFNTHLNFYLFTLPFYTGGSYPPMQVFTGM